MYYLKEINNQTGESIVINQFKNAREAFNNADLKQKHVGFDDKNSPKASYIVVEIDSEGNEIESTRNDGVIEDALNSIW